MPRLREMRGRRSQISGGSISRGLSPGTKSILLNMNGANGGTTFTDASVYARVINAFGSLETNTSIKKYGTAALNTNISSNTTTYLNTVDAAELRLGARDFCLEAWVYYAAAPTNGQWSPCIWAKATSPSNIEYVGGLVGGAAGAAAISFYASTNGTTYDITLNSGSFTPTTGVWHHVAVTRYGTELRFFWDGSQVGATQTLSATVFGGTAPWRCIGFNSNTVSYNGRLDDVAITMDSPVYITTFTPPIVELTQ